MKKFVPQKIASRVNTKKTSFINIKTKIDTQNSHEPSEYPQSINKPKNVAVYFKDVITEETFSSQDQKLVETINLWRQLFSAQIRFCNDR